MGDKRRVKRELNFDLNAMQQRAYVGVRRAAAFLGLSERFLEGEFPRSLTLGRAVKRQFLPDPLREEQVVELRENWQTWVIGNALRELDQFLSLYLDEAYDKVQQAKLVAGEHPANHQWDRIDRQTNVAEKHQMVLEVAGKYELTHVEDQNCLRSLSAARNCLSHDLGIVTPRRANDGALTVRWLALRTEIQQGENVIILDEAVMPIKLDPKGGEGRAVVRVQLVERQFEVGTCLGFTPDDLLDICLFYQIVIDRVARATTEYAQECGVAFAPADAPAGPTDYGGLR